MLKPNRLSVQCKISQASRGHPAEEISAITGWPIDYVIRQADAWGDSDDDMDIADFPPER